MTTATTTVDCLGLACPIPVVRLARAVASVELGGGFGDPGADGSGHRGHAGQVLHAGAAAALALVAYQHRP